MDRLGEKNSYSGRTTGPVPQPQKNSRIEEPFSLSVRFVESIVDADPPPNFTEWNAPAGAARGITADRLSRHENDLA